MALGHRIYEVRGVVTVTCAWTHKFHAGPSSDKQSPDYGNLAAFDDERSPFDSTRRADDVGADASWALRVRSTSNDCITQIDPEIACTFTRRRNGSTEGVGRSGRY